MGQPDPSPWHPLPPPWPCRSRPDGRIMAGHTRRPGLPRVSFSMGWWRTGELGESGRATEQRRPAPDDQNFRAGRIGHGEM